MSEPLAPEARGTIVRTISTFLLAAATAVALGTTAPASAAPPTVPDPAHLSAHVVTTFGYAEAGTFLESIAADGHGALIGSLNTWGVMHDDGSSEANVLQLVRMRPDGTRSNFGPAITVGPCAMGTGVTVDAQGNVFATINNFVYLYGAELCGPGNVPSSVLRVTSGGWSTAMTLPEGTFPNGLTSEAGKLYVADSNGAIWRGSTTHVTAPTKPWYGSTLLEPTGDAGIGADGIAFRAGAVYVTTYGQGLLLRIPLAENGDATKARVVSSDTRLVGADGLAFDAIGRAWITVNPRVDWAGAGQIGDGHLVVVTPSGQVSVAAAPSGSLDYPTQAVFDGHGTVYVANGSYYYGTPGLVAFTG